MAGEQNNDGKVVIEVTLSDKESKKFFADLKKDASKTGADISKNSGIGDAFSAKNIQGFKTELAGLASRFALVGGAAAGVGLAIKKAFDFGLAGEKLQSIDTVFDRIANSQGLAGLRQQLVSAAGGLVDVGDLLQKAGSSVANLGELAGELPKLLALATQSAKQFGGTAEDSFQAMIQAVESGNVKVLRQQGLFIDANKAMGEYAKTLGLTASELNQTQRQQVILNSILEEGTKRTKAAGESVTPLADASKQLGLGLKAMADDLIKSTSNAVNPFFTAITQGLADVITGMNKAKAAYNSALANPAANAANLYNQIKSSEYRIASLRTQLADLRKPGADWDAVSKATRLSAELVKLEKNLPRLREEFKKTGAVVSEVVPADAADKASKATKKLTDEQLAAIRGRNMQIAALQVAAATQYLAVEQQRLDQEADNDKTRLERKALLDSQIFMLEMQRNAELEKIGLDFSTERGFTDEQREAARLAIVDKYKALTEQAVLAGNAKILAAEKKFAEQTSTIIRTGLLNTTTNALESLGQSLAQGAMDWGDFNKAVVGTVGDMAISLGKALIAQGLALEAFVQAINSLLPGSGAAAAAAGVGLVLFGAAIKASVGAGGGAGTGGFQPGSAGGEPIITEPVSETPLNESIERQSPNTEVSVVIQGNVLDSDESGLRIVQIINDAFDKQGVVVKRGAIA